MEVKRVVKKIEDALTILCDACRGSGFITGSECPVCEGLGKTSTEDETVVLMACLSTALMLQHNNISAKELMQGVLGASEWISLYLSSLEDGDLEQAVPNNKIN